MEQARKLPCFVISVARMCYESTAFGAEVFVDTTGARATDNSPGPLCFCNATVNNAKFITLSVDGQNSTCGSKLQFTFSKAGVFPVETNEANCLKIEHKEQIHQQEVVTMQLVKLKSPYVVDFCTRIKIGKSGNISTSLVFEESFIVTYFKIDVYLASAVIYNITIVCNGLHYTTPHYMFTHYTTILYTTLYTNIQRNTVLLHTTPHYTHNTTPH